MVKLSALTSGTRKNEMVAVTFATTAVSGSSSSSMNMNNNNSSNINSNGNNAGGGGGGGEKQRKIDVAVKAFSALQSKSYPVFLPSPLVSLLGESAAVFAPLPPMGLTQTNTSSEDSSLGGGLVIARHSHNDSSGNISLQPLQSYLNILSPPYPFQTPLIKAGKSASSYKKKYRFLTIVEWESLQRDHTRLQQLIAEEVDAKSSGLFVCLFSTADLVELNGNVLSTMRGLVFPLFF